MPCRWGSRSWCGASGKCYGRTPDAYDEKKRIQQHQVHANVVVLSLAVCLPRNKQTPCERRHEKGPTAKAASREQYQETDKEDAGNCRNPPGMADERLNGFKNQFNKVHVFTFKVVWRGRRDQPQISTRDVNTPFCPGPLRAARNILRPIFSPSPRMPQRQQIVFFQHPDRHGSGVEIDATFGSHVSPSNVKWMPLEEA